MGHRQDMTPEQRLKWDCDNYRKRIESKRGRNYEYWKDEKHNKMLENGWNLYVFTEKSRYSWGKKMVKHAVSSEDYAKLELSKIRKGGNFARIVCGYEQNRQRIKMYSIIFKPKKK